MSKIGIGIGEDFPVDAPLRPEVDEEARAAAGRQARGPFRRWGGLRGCRDRANALRGHAHHGYFLVFAIAALVALVAARR